VAARCCEVNLLSDVPALTNELLTDSELCDMLDVSSRTTMRWRRDGGGPAFVRVGERRIMYRRSDVTAWLTARTFPHRAAEAVAQSITN